MPAKKPPPKDEKPQRQRFEEAAREAQVDESGREFEHAIKKVVTPAKRKS